MQNYVQRLRTLQVNWNGDSGKSPGEHPQNCTTTYREWTVDVGEMLDSFASKHMRPNEELEQDYDFVIIHCLQHFITDIIIMESQFIQFADPK